MLNETPNLSLLFLPSAETSAPQPVASFACALGAGRRRPPHVGKAVQALVTTVWLFLSAGAGRLCGRAKPGLQCRWGIALRTLGDAREGKRAATGMRAVRRSLSRPAAVDNEEPPSARPIYIRAEAPDVLHRAKEEDPVPHSSSSGDANSRRGLSAAQTLWK